MKSILQSLREPVQHIRDLSICGARQAESPSGGVLYNWTCCGHNRVGQDGVK